MLQNVQQGAAISTHAPRTGRDERMRELLRSGVQFQPTLPARGATFALPYHSGLRKISTHAPRTGSDLFRLHGLRALDSISTHAPRTGSDFLRPSSASRRFVFQPTLPARGATIVTDFNAGVTGTFQPTLPARGATWCWRKEGAAWSYFNPRSPHGERRAKSGETSAHSLFQPTLPARQCHLVNPPTSYTGRRIA